MTRILTTMITSLALFIATNAFAQEPVLIGDVPLPEDVVSAPSDTQPFLGAWVGKWDNWKDHVLVVERINENGLADVVYAVGRDENGAGNWLRAEAEIDGDTLRLRDDSFPVRYFLSPTGRMRGVFGDNERFAILERHPLPAMLASPGDDWFSVGVLDYLDTDLVEDGQTVKLATMIYTPKGDGPFPLALIHHGSTGSGKQPIWFKHVWTNDWLADILNQNGWIAAFPQRRGRGGSDGLYDEGFADDRSDGYSPKAAVSIAGADRALADANAVLAALRQRPDVQPGPTLLAGVSRGGVVAILQAGQSPDDAAGVINFVGGWVSEGCCDEEINPTLFRRIGDFDGPILSIYGEDDAYYSIDYSKANLAEMDGRGVDSQLHIVEIPGFGKGHWVVTKPNLWEDVLDDYISTVDR